jgi:hypothetical protein
MDKLDEFGDSIDDIISLLNKHDGMVVLKQNNQLKIADEKPATFKKIPIEK